MQEYLNVVLKTFQPLSNIVEGSSQNF